MNAQQYEQRLKAYKKQKYKTLIIKHQLVSKGYNSLEERDVLKTIDQIIDLTNYAINSTSRIIDNLNAIDSEMKSYQIIDNKLQNLMFENNYAEATTLLTRRKLNDVGQHILHLEQLLKYK